MGAARATNLDLSTLSIGGSSVLSDLKEATISFDIGEEESSILTRAYESHSATTRSATLRTRHLSAISAPTKATNLDVSAFLVGGTSYLGHLESGSIDVTWQHGEGKAMSDAWLYPVLVKKSIQGEGNLIVPASSGAMLALKAGNSTLSDLALTFSVTITLSGSAVTFTFAGLLKSFEHMISDAATQKHRVQLIGRDPDSGTFPAAPTGSSTLSEKVINGSAALTVSAVAKASGGAQYDGNFLPKSMKISFSNAGLVTTEYEFASQGAITVVETA